MSNIQIIVVEDSPTQAQEIAFRLSEHDIDVMIATDGPQALRLIEEMQPHLVVLDVNLPSMSGLQVCKRLKRDERTAHIPVVMFTAADRTEDILAGMEAGALDYIPKDHFAAENLLATLQRLGLVRGGNV
ncbi:MAG: response regulator [Anaerolineae bacterium]|nr:response regulator [Anaerolineae bacterium]